jgi:decaprenylphospho-beta-D-erythro-pentofuranosid-2-ulose 2-reductase
MKKILIIGATSAIAEACARRWIAEAEHLFLVGRNPQRLEYIAADLKIKGKATITTYAMDLNDIENHSIMLDLAQTTLNQIDLVLIAHGTLSDQQVCEHSVQKTIEEIHTNGLSVIALLTSIANRFEAHHHGHIAVISSVAGDRGRQSNYVYGTAKSMVSTFTSGLRQRLAKSGIPVLTIKPGFVDTPMTAQFKKNKLWAQPNAIAQAIDHAIASKKSVLYTPFFWLIIMTIIKLIPERFFKKLSL